MVEYKSIIEVLASIDRAINDLQNVLNDKNMYLVRPPCVKYLSGKYMVLAYGKKTVYVGNDPSKQKHALLEVGQHKAYYNMWVNLEALRREREVVYLELSAIYSRLMYKGLVDVINCSV